MPYKDPAAQREYQRQWAQKRRLEWLQAHGPCAWCGSWEDLEVDHIDPNQKVDHKVWSWSQARRDAELAKCQALCRPCHRKKTDDAWRRLRHGTNAGYTSKYRCRCTPCTEAHRLEMQRWRDKGT